MWKCPKKFELEMKSFTPLLLLPAAFLWLALRPLEAQSMIGMDKDAIQALVKEGHREFRPDRSVVSQRFNYLKYVNGLRTRTWIIYFDEKDRCKSTKLVCDYGEFDEVLEELNRIHEHAGDSEWYYRLGRDTVQVILSRQEWYFTVREARKD
jgi:hypothetical protein